MAELLSLKWNNHKSTFFHVLATIRTKESYSDVTVACDGRFYSLHKFVLSTCSEYFEEMFERTQCKHPVIVLKDINSEDLEALLNYMYVGEVNVVQEKLAGLIKAAECLKIKGLAVPDEDPMESKDNSSVDREQHKRSQRGEDSPRAKRRRRENSSDISEEILSPVRSRPSARNREYHSSQNAKSAPVAPSEENEDGSKEINELTDASEESENSSINANRQINISSNKSNLSQSINERTQKKEKITEESVKVEPIELESEATDNVQIDEDEQDNKSSLHQALGLSQFVDTAALLEPPQTMDEVVAEVIPGASEYQASSFLWEGDSSLSAFPAEGFSGDSSQSRQMVWPPTQPLSMNTTTSSCRSAVDLRQQQAADGESHGHDVSSTAVTGAASMSFYSPMIKYVPSSGRSMRSTSKNFTASATSKGKTEILQGLPPVQLRSASYKCKFCARRYQSETYVRKHVLRKHRDMLSTSCSNISGAPIPLLTDNSSTVTGNAVSSSGSDAQPDTKVISRKRNSKLRSQAVASRVRPIRPKTDS
ncbi:BTB/POZ domain [Trinorchestia longiramus]|nr:BTB/POZ domain [Trinorchestia longiramus]